MMNNNNQDELRALKWAPDQQPLHPLGAEVYPVLQGVMVMISILQRRNLRVIDVDLIC